MVYRFQASELVTTCNDFLTTFAEFKSISDSLAAIFGAVSHEVEREKISAIGARNLLQTSTKIREMQLQQLSGLIVEKQHQLDRLSVELSALVNVEAGQNDFIEQFVLQK